MARYEAKEMIELVRSVERWYNENNNNQSIHPVLEEELPGLPKSYLHKLINDAWAQQHSFYGKKYVIKCHKHINQILDYLGYESWDEWKNRKNKNA